MKSIHFLVALVMILAVDCCFAQTTLPADDSKPASTNIPGQQYPRIDSQLRATFRVSAPNAKSVRISVGKTFDLTKGDDGIWTGTSSPLVPGFHYYSLVIDGVSVADPASEAFFGVSKMSSGIEVPEKGVDFYDARPVPHGEVRSHWYFSRITNSMRRGFVYTPPDYDSNTSARYPVLYLQHGMGEDARGWSTQGHANYILDNLIAEGKSRPMIIVMDDGGIAAGMGGRGGGGGRRGGGAPPAGAPQSGAPQARGGPATMPSGGAPGAVAGGRGARGGGMGSEFTQVLINDIIPTVDSTYRTIADRDHRAMAGLSMGGTQTWQITQANLDKFAYIGSFSAPFGFPDVKNGFGGLIADPAAFARQVRVLYVSMGSEEVNGLSGSKTFHEALDAAGVKHVYYESPGTAHEWQTWRKSLYGFAPLLFQN